MSILKDINRSFVIPTSSRTFAACDGAARKVQGRWFAERILLEGEVILYEANFARKRPPNFGTYFGNRFIKKDTFDFIRKKLKDTRWLSDKEAVRAFNRQVKRGIAYGQ